MTKSDMPNLCVITARVDEPQRGREFEIRCSLEG